MQVKHAKAASEHGWGKFKIGAAIYSKKGRLISTGFNQDKTHPKFGSNEYQKIHAEGAALWKAIKNNASLEDAYIIVYRIRGNLAKPCPGCQELLRFHGIKTMFYTYGNNDELQGDQ